MGLPLANVQTNDTFQTWLTRTNQIIEVAANSTPLSIDVQESLTANTIAATNTITGKSLSITQSAIANTIAVTNTLTVGKYLDLTANTTDIAHAEGRVFYDNVNKALAVYNDEADITLQVGQENYIRVYNETGSAITNGTPVYINGATNGNPTVAPADASSAASIYAIGLATHTIEDSSYGYVTVQGIVRGLNTSGITPGSTVHVAPGGGFQSAAPAYPNFAHEVGFVVTSDATNGSIYVVTVQHYLEQLRVANDLRVAGDFTVEGNFNVLGAENLTTITNLEVADTFVYLSRGDTVTANSTAVTGLNDLTFKGHYNATNNYVFYVKIDSTDGGPDLFSWSLDNFSSTEAANVAITSGTEQSLAYGISVLFNANTGHTAGDVWTGAGAPTNSDVGLVGNRNTGNTGVGYTHMGVFFDVTDERFKFFEAYRPEVSGNINTGHATFTLGQVQANNFIGGGALLTGLNASELSTGTVDAARFPASGVTANTYGSASKVPVITVTDKGIVTEITETNVAGVSTFTYTQANSTFTIGTADGGSFKATITDADTTNKGVASFSTDNFSVTSGVVTIKDDGIILGTETTGNYVASVSNTDSTLTVSGTGEGAAVTVGLSTAGAGAASYSSGISAITVDSFGRVTSVSGSANYSTTTGTVTSVAISGTNITVADSPITSSGTITISIPQAVATSSDVQFDSFGVGTAASGTTGEIRATNNITAYYSDQRLKKNIRPIDSALDKVMQISGVLFENNEIAAGFGYTDPSEQVGVIAQEIEQVLPHVVTAAPFDLGKDENGNDYSISGENYKTVRYEKLVPLLIQAIKELKQLVDSK